MFNTYLKFVWLMVLVAGLCHC